jgi:hypothetical protein
VGDTTAKRAHEDVTELGQRYISDGERPWIEEMGARKGGYFVDLGSGAQPRIAAGAGMRRHVCVDLSLSGLQQCRAQLGDRGMYVCGSLLNMPLVPGLSAGALMAHCLYHIDRDQQPLALRNAFDLMAVGGELVVLYANPRSVENVATGPLRRLMRSHKLFYFAPLTVKEVLSVTAAFPGAVVRVGTLRSTSRVVSQPLFSLFGALGFRMLRLLDRVPPRLATYVAYQIRRA